MTTSEIPEITIPRDIRPADGRFGCGPSKVRPIVLDELASVASTYKIGRAHV